MPGHHEDWAAFSEDYKQSSEKNDFYLNKVEEIVRSEADLEEGEDYRTKLGLLTVDQLMAKDFEWSHSTKPMDLSKVLAQHAEACGSQRPVFDAMLLVKRLVELSPGFNPDDPRKLKLSIKEGHITLLKGTESIIADSAFLEEQAIAEAKEAEKKEAEERAEKRRATLMEVVITPELIAETKEAMNYKNIASLDEESIVKNLVILQQGVISGRIMPDEVKELLVPDEDYMMAMFYSDSFIDSTFSTVGERFKDDESPYAKAYLAQFENLETAQKYKDLHLKVLSEYSHVFTPNLDMTVRGGLFPSGVEALLPPKESLHENHSDAIDIFFTEADSRIIDGVEVGPEIRTTVAGVVVATSDDWEGGDTRDEFVSGGLSPVSGNGVIIYNPATNEYHQYLHLSSVDVKPGDILEAGSPLGRGGNTGINARKEGHGSHLHYVIHEIADEGGISVVMAEELHDRVTGYLNPTEIPLFAEDGKIERAHHSTINRIAEITDAYLDQVKSSEGGDIQKMVKIAEIEGRIKPEDKLFLERLMALTPEDFGKVGELIDNGDDRVSFVDVEGGTNQILPKHVHEAYKTMVSDCLADTGQDITLTRGYEAGGYQLSKLLKVLTTNGYDLGAALEKMQLPNYSDHQSVMNPGMDLNMSDEAMTWMSEHSADYGFSLLEADGVHWRYVAEEPEPEPENPEPKPSLADSEPEMIQLPEVIYPPVFKKHIERTLSRRSEFKAAAARAEVPVDEFAEQRAKQLIETMTYMGLELTRDNAALLMTLQLQEGSFYRETEKSGEEIVMNFENKYGRKVDGVRFALGAYPPLQKFIEDQETLLKECKSEHDLYVWANNLADKIESDWSGDAVPPMAQKALASLLEFVMEEEIDDPVEFSVDKLRKEPSTLGRYQINIDNVLVAASADIDEIKRHPEWSALVKEDGSLDRDLLARSLFYNENPAVAGLLKRSVAEAFILKYYLVPIMESNDLSKPGDLSKNEALYIGADFHAGPYASRNTAVQDGLNKMNMGGGEQLVLDGDLCFYGDDRLPDLSRQSNTMKGLLKFAEFIDESKLEGMTPEEAVKTFVALSRGPELESHPLWKALIVDNSLDPRVVPSGADTDNPETHASGFAVTDAQQYALRTERNMTGFGYSRA